MKSPLLNFLFMDESYCQTAQISALAGLLVPIHKYAELRDSFYAILQPYIQPELNTIDHAPEIHGFKLPGKDDAEKLRIVGEIVNLVVSNKLRIHRVGYYITEKIRQAQVSDPLMLGTCWASLMFMLQPQLADEMIVPVMDGFDRHNVRRFSGWVKSIDEMRAAGARDLLSINNTENLIGEVFYADSQYSVFIQVIDIVAYLRKVTDLVVDGHPLLGFKNQLLPFAQKLNSAILTEHIIAFNLNGEIQGPSHRRCPPMGDNGPLTGSFIVTPSDDKDVFGNNVVN